MQTGTGQVCQLTEHKQTTEWERYPNRFRCLCETLLPENLGKCCREWPGGKTESDIKLLVHKTTTANRKTQCTLMALSPKPSQGGASLSSKVRPPSMKTVQLDNGGGSSQQWRWKRSPREVEAVNSGGGSSHPCPPLDCFKK